MTTELCRHCGKPPEADGDHSCTCPYPDDFCPDHPRPEDPWNTAEQCPTCNWVGRHDPRSVACHMLPGAETREP